MVIMGFMPGAGGAGGGARRPSQKVGIGIPNANGVSARWVSLLCIASFCLGVFAVNRFFPYPVNLDDDALPVEMHHIPIHPAINCENKETRFNVADIVSKVSQTNAADIVSKVSQTNAADTISKVSQTNAAIVTLDRAISSLEMQLAYARAAKTHGQERSPVNAIPGSQLLNDRPKFFFVMGIITAFSSRKRRDSIRQTWMPQGDDLSKLEKDRGILIRFVIGHSATPGGVLDRAIDAEEAKHNDFLRLNHIEGYHELSSKTQIYFSTAASKWDADFYIKVDDDVHVNLAVIGSSLARYRSKPRVYIGCMKSGPVLGQKGVKYHEPEYWKFGEEGNKYFRHATGQIYAISKDLATYISVNRHILHRYANEDVSLGSWFIGLDIEHVDDRSLCCGTPPDCEWKAEAGNTCAASFDWSCSGICKSVERMEEVHQRCGEGDGAIWHAT